MPATGARRRPGDPPAAHRTVRQACRAADRVAAVGVPCSGDGAPGVRSEAGRHRGTISLFTIGYQGRTVEDYLGMLSRAQVTVLCDVRRNAISRKRGFSKRALAGACEQIDIRYEHLPDLGIGAERRRLVRTDRDRQLLLAEYLKVDLARRPSSLDRIVSWAASGERVAVTCFEREFSSCHRSLVAAEVERLGGPSIATVHLG